MGATADYQRIRALLIEELGDIASNWAESILNTSYVPLSGDEVVQRMAELTENAITAVTSQPFNHQMAEEIGASLVELNFTQPEALGFTQHTLSSQLLYVLNREDQLTILPQIISLIREIGIGFTRQSQNKILKEQQELRKAVERGKSEAERARRHMELRNQAVLRALPDAMYVLNLDGKFCDFHVNHPETSLVPIEEIIEKNIKDLLPYNLATEFDDLAHQAIETGEVQVLIGSLTLGTQKYHYEFRIVPYLEGQVLTIVRDITERIRLDEELKKHRENLEDLVLERTNQLRITNERLRLEIEERQLVEERLRESKEQLEIIVNGVADGIILVDSEGRKLVANPAAASIQGYENLEEYLNDNNVLDKFEIMYENGDPVPRFDLPMNKAIRGEEFPPMMLRYRFRGTQGELWALVQATPIFDTQGRVRFVVVIFHDFTEHKKAEEYLKRARSQLERRVRERTAELATINQQLQLLTRQMINAQEYERRSLARDLHDVILSQIGATLIMMDESTPVESARSKLLSLTDQIRNIINGLRPPMLNFGLGTAIDELYDDLIDQAQDGTEIRLNINYDDVRYNPEVELHLYRILQQACNNALRHAKATELEIHGYLKPDEGKLTVIDDGIGMELDDKLNLSESLSNKHYGLAGMFERAKLIRANLKIDSKKGQGTRVEIVWTLDN